ncbi:MAG: YbgC/FadM family acyl-CoA thioesterase [Alphaproteobacteria bacterium]
MFDSSGVIDGDAHRLPMRVYYEDTDSTSMVYYANYLKFAERGRTEMIRLLGVPDGGRENGAAFAVRRCQIDYLRPARLDDHIDVWTKLMALGGASAELDQVVRRDDVVLARLAVRLAYVTLAGKPARLPTRFRAALKPFLKS